MYGWSANNWSFLIRILMDYGSFRIIWTHCIASHGWRSTTWIPTGIPYVKLIFFWFYKSIYLWMVSASAFWWEDIFLGVVLTTNLNFQLTSAFVYVTWRAARSFLYALESDIMFPFLWTFWTFDPSFILYIRLYLTLEDFSMKNLIKFKFTLKNNIFSCFNFDSTNWLLSLC